MIRKELSALIWKEFILEWRQRYALGGIALYVVSTVYIIFFTFTRLLPQSWNAMFWVVALFAAVNAVAKSFAQENSQRQLYYYTLAHPIGVIIAKMIYNTVLLFVLMLLSFGAFSLLTGNPVQRLDIFFLVLLMASFGFAIAFTFISGIAAKANQNSTLMAILGFPVVIPILAMLIRLSANALRILDSNWSQDIMMLLAIDAILLTLALILFPFLWRD